MRIMILRMALTATILFSMSVAGCSSDNPVSEKQTAPELTFEVDPQLKPANDSLPGHKQGEVRPLGAVMSSDGIQADFVVNEIWISSDDQGVIEQIIADLNAEVVAEVEAQSGVFGSLPKQTLLRFDPSTVGSSDLIPNLEDLNQESFGEHHVSSTDCLGLFNAVSSLALEGIDVGVNWVGQNASIINRESNEAPTGPGPYDSNSFLWDTHSIDSNQNIGVAEAWRGLELAGKTGNKIPIAILDQGFEINGDTPDGWTATSNIPFRDALNQPNLFNCSGGNECNWHGTNVLSAAMAVPDDQFGGAGPAGQVGEPIIVSTTGDFFMSIRALWLARSLGARIANMSYGVGVPVVFGFTVLPFEFATAALRESGMLIFAAAGNDGKNVDDESCFILCVENTWWTPCENAGVICVGGLFANTANRANGSNYGKKQVDIFAPFTVYVGPDPDHPDNQVRSVSGTSFSSPFAAGVAAMIWAANPDLGADEVESILMETAHSSPDDEVKRYVNALGGIRAALGNVPPSIDVFGNSEITRMLNQEVRLNVLVSDFEEGNNCCEATWVSDVDGNLGSGNSLVHVFETEGTRHITISASDSQGALGQEIITLTIENAAPRTTITKPTAGEVIIAGIPYGLKGHAVDVNEPDSELDCSRLVWTSSNNSDPFPVVGCEPTVQFSSLGTRILTLKATDPQGLSESKQVLVSIVAPPDNLPPAVSITSPQNGVTINIFELVDLSGNATDPEGNNPLTYEWSVNWGEGKVVIGNSPTISWDAFVTLNAECDGRWDIRATLKATDSLGASGTDFVDLKANWICK